MKKAVQKSVEDEFCYLEGTGSIWLTLSW